MKKERKSMAVHFKFWMQIIALLVLGAFPYFFRIQLPFYHIVIFSSLVVLLIVFRLAKLLQTELLIFAIGVVIVLSSLYIVFAVNHYHRREIRHPKLEVFFHEGVGTDKDQRFRYVHLLSRENEPETVTIQFDIFNFGDESAENVVVDILIPLYSFDLVNKGCMNITDTSRIRCGYKDMKTSLPYIRLHRNFGSDIVLPIKACGEVGKITLVTKRPLVCAAPNEVGWDYDAILIAIRYDRSLNTGPKRGWLLVVSPLISDTRLTSISHTLLARNHAIANGERSKFTNDDLFDN